MALYWTLRVLLTAVWACLAPLFVLRLAIELLEDGFHDIVEVVVCLRYPDDRP